MKPHDLKSMSVDELLSLHEFVSAALARKIPAEKARLDQRLRQLGLATSRRKIDVSGIEVNGLRQDKTRRGERRACVD